MNWIVASMIASSLCASSAAFAQSNTNVLFEVASVKPHIDPPGRFSFGTSPISISGARVAAMGTLSGLVTLAYNVTADQVSGGPGWAQIQGGDMYDIVAKAEGPGAPTMTQAREMLRNLLADRFRLAVHSETKDLPVFELIVGKNGSKLKESASDAQPSGGATHNGPLTRVIQTKRTIAQLVLMLAPSVDRPVVDKTGLLGTYDFSYEFANVNPSTLDSGGGGASIYTAVEKDLGLKLVPAKRPTEILVIDHAEKSSDN